MSKDKSTLNRITVRQRPGSGSSISTGANTQVFLDGVELGGITALTLEFRAAKVTKVYMDMLVAIDEIDGQFLLGRYTPVYKDEPEEETKESTEND